MSTLLVADYQRRIAELVQYGSIANEDSIRKAFARLLKVIDLMARVTTVSVETMRIVSAMPVTTDSESA